MGSRSTHNAARLLGSSPVLRVPAWALPTYHKVRDISHPMPKAAQRKRVPKGPLHAQTNTERAGSTTTPVSLVSRVAKPITACRISQPQRPVLNQRSIPIRAAKVPAASKLSFRPGIHATA